MKKLVLVTTLLMLSHVAFAAPMLNVDSAGQLLGAQGLDVNGTLYDVSFVDGTCVELFTGCDEASDFSFTTQAEAVTAAQALIDFVFVDSPLGNFDSVPSLTFGVTSSTFSLTYIPFGINTLFGADVTAATAVNLSSEGPLERTQISGLSFGFDSTASPPENFAVFTPTPVPEPATLLLLATGLAGLGFTRRRTKRITTD